MLKNNYNYILNGIPHEVNLNSSIKIKSNPLDEKKLLSNKFMMKILNDLFIFLSIEYCLINKTLLGQKIFKGINIFEENIEILIQKNYLKKLLKEQDFLHNNKIIIENVDNKYIILKTFFYKDIEVLTYIYLFNEENNVLSFYNDNKIYNLEFYDVFPIRKDDYEEFKINIPNKVENVLTACEINLKYINFKSYKTIVKTFFENNLNVFYCMLYVLLIINNKDL